MNCYFCSISSGDMKMFTGLPQLISYLLLICKPVQPTIYMLCSYRTGPCSIRCLVNKSKHFLMSSMFVSSILESDALCFQEGKTRTAFNEVIISTLNTQNDKTPNRRLSKSFETSLPKRASCLNIKISSVFLNFRTVIIF